MTQIIHDVPVVGIFTSAIADSIWSTPTPEEMKEAFNKVDFHHSGTIDRSGVAEALRLLEKSERQVQKLMDQMEPDTDTLDLEGFQKVAVPGPQPWTWELGGVLPVPNHAKILDTPLLGPILNLTQDSMAQPIDSGLRSWRKTIYSPSDHAMKVIFLDADSDKNGKLDKQELPNAMRKLYKTEKEIKQSIEDMDHDLTFFEFKRLIRGVKYSPSNVNYVPMVGAALATNLLAAFDDDVPEEDQKEAFEYIDKSKNGKLDKTEVADLLRELGKSEMEIQKLIDYMPAEELDFEAFTNWWRSGLSRPLMTNVSGYRLPNPAKVHDLPIIGTCTSLTQDFLVDSYGWTAGAAVKTLNMMTPEELKKYYEELDTEKKGVVSMKRIAKAFRESGMSEYDIKWHRDSCSKDEVTLEEFMRLMRIGQVEDPDVKPPAAEG